MKLYIYYDADHGNLEVFKTLAKAKKHAEKEWPDSDDYKEEWDDDCGDDIITRGEYQMIFIREIK